MIFTLLVFVPDFGMYKKGGLGWVYVGYLFSFPFSIYLYVLCPCLLCMIDLAFLRRFSFFFRLSFSFPVYIFFSLTSSFVAMLYIPGQLLRLGRGEILSKYTPNIF